MSHCSCGRESSYEKCCEKIIKNIKSATGPEDIMRARYSAYAHGEIDFIIESTHPDSREDLEREHIEQWSSQSKWNKLDIVDADQNETDGKVEFKAYYHLGGKDYTHHEISDFKKLDGVWYFHDGKELSTQVQRTGPKVGRNDPCPCDSGKKYKKCCGR